MGTEGNFDKASVPGELKGDEAKLASLDEIADYKPYNDPPLADHNTDGQISGSSAALLKDQPCANPQAIADDAAWRRRDARQVALNAAVQVLPQGKPEHIVAAATQFADFLEG